ncbi:MAG: hypothetical protein EBX37_19095, partial [Alphaproteobacteria bacterium]|nr:hypothetical protein [Alphaproteobacteria bacterium]
MIPKVVFQTWYRKDMIPESFQTIIKKNREINPEFEFEMFDDDEVEQFFRRYEKDLPVHIVTAYHRINPRFGPCRADIFRYAIIYVKGGIYMDIKVRCIVPFQDWINFEEDRAVFSYWSIPHQISVLKNRFGELQNWFLVFRPKDPRLWQLLQSITNTILRKEGVHVGGKNDILHLTGPIIFTKNMETALDPAKGDRLVLSRQFLDYGGFFHQKLLGKEHYVYYYEPLLLRLFSTHRTMPYRQILSWREMTSSSSSFLLRYVPPGLYWRSN